nr:coproporphyrinogen III oxidase-like [Nerophis lumbriciformis]
MTYDLLILGGGITGLAALYEAHRGSADGPAPRCLLVEAAERLGGKVESEARDGFLLEAGADAVLAHKPWAMDLIRELGLEDRLLPSRDEQRQVYLVHRGELVALPASLRLFVPTAPQELFEAGLLSAAGLDRVRQERDVPVRASDADESVAQFVRRRFGSELLERLAEPILAHIHVAEIERMSLRATYPHLAAMEQRHGSLSAAFEQARPMPEPLFWSLRGGLGELLDELRRQLPESCFKLGTAATRLTPTANDWRVTLASGEELAAREVVLALPAPAAAGLTAEHDPRLASRLGTIRHVPLATASFGYRRSELGRALDGFGFFVPRGEQRRILACTWSSTKFDHRAPPEMALMRVFLGGAAGQRYLKLDDDRLLAELADELAQIMDFSARPLLSRLFRSPGGYPQYDIGHLERLTELREGLPVGLHLAGAAYDGVGLPDCIRSGRATARAALGRAAENIAR